MDVLVVVDMQKGLLLGEPKHALDDVVERINAVSASIRARGGRVIFVQHDGPPGDDFAPFETGWTLLDEIDRDPRDRSVRKTLNDSFFETSLDDELEALRVARLFIAGWATDLCVDATVRSAVARGYAVTVVSDGHTVSDRPHLRAPLVIAHHHWVWQNLIARHPVRLAAATSV